MKYITGITDLGKTLLRDLSLNDLSLTAANAVTSEVLITDIDTAANIVNVKQTFDYTVYSAGGNQFVMEAQVTNAGVMTEYALNSLGFYASKWR